jgi:hypothetical protein
MLIYLLAFSILFYYPGFRFFGILVNIPLIILLLLDIVIISKWYFNQRDILFIGLFILWCLIGVIFRYPISSYLLSLLFTTALILPLGASLKHLDIDVERMLNYLILGVFVSISFIPFELYFRYMHLFGFSGNEIWLNVGGHYMRYYRASSTMMEPSHYAIVLTFIYVILDIARSRGYQIKNLILFRYCYFTALVLGASLSGIAMIGFYFFIKAVYFIIAIVQRKFQVLVSKRVLAYLVVGVTLLFTLNILSHNFVGKVVSRMHDRVLLTKEAIQHQKSEGSSGVRSNFLWISGKYLESSSFGGIMFGEGYSHYHFWLIKNAKNIGYNSSEIYNLFFVLLLSTGIFGLLWFIIMNISVLNVNFRDANDIAFLLLFFVSFLTHGYLVMYWVFVPVLFYKLVPGKNQVRRSDIGA